MTTSPTPNFRLDPSALADTVPLRRVGTEEVHFPLLLVRFVVFSQTFKDFVLNPLSQDMAGTILFLASRAGAYVNGAVWLVDGGRVGTVASNY
jgi:NAD(P)-dependent dehydrogenase (short-subunit alcohol dehydrogenase family)